MNRWLLAAIAVILCLPPCSAFAQEQVLYYHTDATGSVLITDANGQVVERHDYLPFGEEYPLTQQQPSVEKRLFGGKEHDQETGFEYSLARYYAGGTGRFTTVDPGHVGGDIFDPQSWNGYAYALNNPLRFVDPLGTEPCQITLTGEDAAAAGIADGGTVEGECVKGKNPSAVNRRAWFAEAFSNVLDLVTGTATVGAPENGTAATWTPQEPILNPYLVAAAAIIVSKHLPSGGIVAETGGIVAKNGVRITGFTKHGIDRVVGDTYKRAGTRPQAILDALKNPTKEIVTGVDELGRPFQIFTGKDARVVVNPQTGQVVSVNPRSRAGAH
jgi:RHS repeat-associated protein